MTGALFYRPAGGEDGDDERRHHAVQAGGERSAAAQVHVPAAESDRFDGTHRQGRQSPHGYEGVHAGGPSAEETCRPPEEGPPAGHFHRGGEEENGPARRRGLGAEDGQPEGGDREHPSHRSPESPVIGPGSERSPSGSDLSCRVTGAGDRLTKSFGIRGGDLEGDVGPGGGEVDRCADHTVAGRESSFDPIGAGGTVHSADRQLDAPQRRLAVEMLAGAGRGEGPGGGGQHACGVAGR